MKDTLRNFSAGLALAATASLATGCEKPSASETVIDAGRVATIEEINKALAQSLQVVARKAKDVFGAHWNVIDDVPFVYKGREEIKIDAIGTFGAHISDADMKGIEEIGAINTVRVLVELDSKGVLKIVKTNLAIGDKTTGQYTEAVSLNYFNGKTADSETIRDIEKAATRALLMHVKKVKEQKE